MPTSFSMEFVGVACLPRALCRQQMPGGSLCTWKAGNSLENDGKRTQMISPFGHPYSRSSSRCSIPHLGGVMKARVLILALGLITSAAAAQKVTDFSGSWDFRPEKSKNIGMMAQMKITETIAQSDSALDITDGNGTKIHYDLSGKAV